MHTTSAYVHRHDDSISSVTFDRNDRCPRYTITLHGELISMYIDTPGTTVPEYLRTVPEGSKFLVGFENAVDRTWWDKLGGAATLEDAEALLVSLADGQAGQAFIVPVPGA